MRRFHTRICWLALVVLNGDGTSARAQEFFLEPPLDPHLQAALAVDQLPSPDATIGLAVAEAESVVVPRIEIGAEQLGAEAEAWPVRTSPPGRPNVLAEPRTFHSWPRQPWAPTRRESLQGHVGLGQPQVGRTWQSEPWYAGAFFGAAIEDDFGQTRDGAVWGARLGWDVSPFHGFEGRIAQAGSQNVSGAFGESASDRFLADASALYYPLGDARWRPYIGLGLGMTAFRLRDEGGAGSDHVALSMPVSIGLKYFHSPHLTLRLDAVENFTFGSDDFELKDRLFLLGSVEFRFGGRRLETALRSP